MSLSIAALVLVTQSALQLNPILVLLHSWALQDLGFVYKLKIGGNLKSMLFTYPHVFVVSFTSSVGLVRFFVLFCFDTSASAQDLSQSSVLKVTPGAWANISSAGVNWTCHAPSSSITAWALCACQSN